MKKQTYQELLQTYIATEKDKESFEYEGKQLAYPWDFYFASVCESYRCGMNIEEAKLDYRKYVRWKLSSLKTEEELESLPFREKLRRYSKNTGLELLASTLEAIFVPLMMGGISVRFDGIREWKEETYYSHRRRQQEVAEYFSERGYGGINDW